MNLEKQIAIRLPAIREARLKEQLRLEKKRDRFVRDFSTKELRTLPLDRFVIGKGNKQTLCYRIERELDGLGRILGATASKFGVYYSKESSSYQHTKKWGDSPEAAFRNLRIGILALLEAGEADDLKGLKGSRISPMFKGKLLHLYFPEKFAPVYSPEHLAHFVACLNLSGIGSSSVEHQQALMEFRNASPSLREVPAGLMMSFLYDEFPLPISDDTTVRDDGDHPPQVKLDDAVSGVRLLNVLPTAGATGDPKPPKPGKFDAQNGRRKFIGDRGEMIVLKFEQQRLEKLKRSDLADRVEHVAATDDTRGFDILSFDEDGTERQIEVKSTSGKTAARGFYLTANELNASRTQTNYHLYFVFEALGASPSLFIHPKVKIESPEFEMRPTQFHVLLKGS